MAYAQLFINGELQPGPGDDAPQGTWEWGATWEERIDGVGQATVVVQDRLLGDYEYGRGITSELTAPPPGFSGVAKGWRDVVRITDGIGGNLFHGEVTNSKLDLPVGHPWRSWNMSASDFNTLFDQRLVGVPDGYTWKTIDGGSTHQAYDPFAVGLDRDGDTVAALIDQYVLLPLLEPSASIAGSTYTGLFETLDTTTFVRNWIPRNIMVDPTTGKSRLGWDHSTLRAAIDEIRGLAGFPIYCWVDPDLKVHWEVLPDPELGVGGPLTLLTPVSPVARDAPATLVHEDVANHSTTIGFRDLNITYDGTYMPQQAYVKGVTDFVYGGGTTRWQGTGFAPHLVERTQRAYWRQISVDAQAVTDREKISVARAYESYANRARIRGSVTVGSDKDKVDGWRVGQLLRIYDSRLPASLYGAALPIQAVRGSLKPGQDWRVYTLEFGDFPIARFSQKYRNQPQKLGTARLPARKHRIHWPTTHLRPSTAYKLYSQMVDHSDKPVRREGVPVSWSLTTTNGAGASVGGGSLSQHGSETDEHGRSSATLTTAATTDLHYQVTVTTAVQE